MTETACEKACEKERKEKKKRGTTGLSKISHKSPISIETNMFG
jgi:hypothetical protein